MIKIIRHAQSLANAGVRIDNPSEAGLSDLGKLQARQLADSFDVAPDLIIVSHAARTKLTAAPLIEKFPNTPVITMPVHEFYFIHDYRIQGTTPDERRKMLHEYFSKNDQDYKEDEHCESFNHFINRVKEFLDSIDYSKNILIISHGHFINGVRQVVEKLPLTVDQFSKIKYVEHCEGLEI